MAREIDAVPGRHRDRVPSGLAGSGLACKDWAVEQVL